MPSHEFECLVIWSGSQQGPTSSYASYSREYTVDIDGKARLTGSAAAPFRGDATLHNPEDLLVAALSACHMLSYLALCARHGVEVVDYRDRATGRMDHVDGGLKFVEVMLRPEVTIRASSSIDRARSLHDAAHRECFIARSVNFEVRHEAIVRPAA
jgi:organic hydroperoxide reductase OsmC/OhrA